MASPDSDQWIIPDVKTPRLYGVLNVAFACLLLLCNLGTAGFYVAAPHLRRMLEQIQTQIEGQQEARYRGRLEELKREEATAPGEAERQAARQKLVAFEARPRPKAPVMTTGFKTMEDRRVIAYGVAEIGTGLVLNLAMLLGGVGLLRRKEWGRRLAVGVAGIKLVRLVLLVTVSIALIIPIQVRAMAPEMAALMEQAQAGGPKGPPGLMFSAQWMSAQSSAMVVLNALAAAVYPVLLLVMLNKARVKAAFLEASKPSAGGVR